MVLELESMSISQPLAFSPKAVNPPPPASSLVLIKDSPFE